MSCNCGKTKKKVLEVPSGASQNTNTVFVQTDKTIGFYSEILKSSRIIYGDPQKVFEIYEDDFRSEKNKESFKDVKLVTDIV